MTESAQNNNQQPNALPSGGEGAVNDSENSVEQSTSIRFGEDAFQDILPQCEVACIVTTPTGKVLKFRTKYIGLHSKNVLLLEMPAISPQETSVFMQRGYAVKACVISSKGEGARVYFKSKIEYVLSGGGSELLLISLPQATQVVVGLRESARLEISLDGTLYSNQNSHSCQIRDISQQGCLLVVDRGKSNCQVGSVIELSIDDGTYEGEVPRLQAVVKNLSKTARYQKLGVRFEENSLQHVQSLIENLNFCSLQQKFTLETLAVHPD